MLNVFLRAIKNVTWRTIVRTLLVMTITFFIIYGLVFLSNHIVDNINNENEYLEAINKLKNDPMLRKQMGEYNINKIKNYSIDSILKQMEKIYES